MMSETNDATTQRPTTDAPRDTLWTRPFKERYHFNTINCLVRLSGQTSRRITHFFERPHKSPKRLVVVDRPFGAPVRATSSSKKAERCRLMPAVVCLKTDEQREDKDWRTLPQRGGRTTAAATLTSSDEA